MSEFLEYQFVEGKRKNSKLLYLYSDKQLFAMKDKYLCKVNYQCMEKECNNRVSILPDGKCVRPKKYEVHNHGTVEKLFEKLNIMEKLKEDCSQPKNLTVPTKRIFNQHCIE